MLNVMIVGVGGQGSLLASRILGDLFIGGGLDVKLSEVHGMAQRGGPVTSHVRIGEGAYSPLIPYGNADLILAFEPAEAVRNLIYLKKDGFIIVNSVPTKPVTESLNPTGYDGSEMIAYLKGKCDCIVIDADALCKPFGSAKFFNIAILGVAAGSGRLGIDKNTVLSEIEKRVPAKYVETNKAAFLAGAEIGERHAIN